MERDRGGGKGRMNGMGRLRKRWRCMDGQRQGRRKKWGNRMEKTDILKKRWSCTDGERQGSKKMGRQCDGEERAVDGMGWGGGVNRLRKRVT